MAAAEEATLPDASGRPQPIAAADPPPRPRRRMSPLLRRVLLLNALPPVLLAASLLYLDQYQAGLLSAEVHALRTQVRITAGGIGEAAVRIEDGRAILVPELARPLLRRLVEPSPATQARLFDTTGLLVADSRVREGPGGAQIVTEPLPPPEPARGLGAAVALLYDRLLSLLPRDAGEVRVDWSPGAPSFEWQPDLGPDRPQDLRAALDGGSLQRELQLRPSPQLGALLDHLMLEQAFGRLQERGEVLERARQWLDAAANDGGMAPCRD